MENRFTWPANHTRTIPIPFANTFPKGLTAHGIQGHHGSIGLASDHDKQPVVSQDGRAANAEKCRRNLPVLRSVPAPEQFARFQFQAQQLTLGAEGVTNVGREQRRRSGPIVIPVWIDKIAVLEMPPE